MARQCFITASSGANVTALIAGLADHGWEAHGLSDVAQLGSSLSESLHEAIATADVVIGLLEDPRNSANTIYELGLAQGMAKPVMVVAPPGADVPSDLASLLLVRAEPTNSVAIASGLEHLSRFEYGRDSKREVRRDSDQPLGNYVQTLIDEFPATSTEREQIQLLAQAIEASGALASVSHRRFDIGVWSDDLDAIGANPLLVILRRGLEEGSVRQCLTALHETPGARAGLIVSNSELPEGHVQGLNWPILAISLTDLLTSLVNYSFAQIVRDLRNRSVHGIPPRQ